MHPFVLALVLLLGQSHALVYLAYDYHGHQPDEPFGISGGLPQYIFVLCCIPISSVSFTRNKSTTTGNTTTTTTWNWICRHLYKKTDVGTPKNSRPSWINKSQHDYLLRQPITHSQTCQLLEILKNNFLFKYFLTRNCKKWCNQSDIENIYRLSRASYIYTCIYISICVCVCDILTISPRCVNHRNLPGER